MTQTVLGIDAAWTDTQPSGVALAAREALGWRLVAVEASYGRFDARARGAPPDQRPPTGETPDARALLQACRRLTGAEPDLVAVDMPLSREPIRGRRASDLEVSRAFGARHCATHSPSAERPGPISDRLRAAFEAEHYALWTARKGRAPGLIEVYPHPALLALMNAPMRLPYKAGKTLTYWAGEPAATRRASLLKVWTGIVAALDREIAGVAQALGAPAAGAVGRALKAYEDRLDAIVCAWVAIRALEGRARPFGDEVSAIWIPQAELAGAAATA